MFMLPPSPILQFPHHDAPHPPTHPNTYLAVVAQDGAREELVTEDALLHQLEPLTEHVGPVGRSITLGLRLGGRCV
jgi:hypothetical protein